MDFKLKVIRKEMVEFSVSYCRQMGKDGFHLSNKTLFFMQVTVTPDWCSHQLRGRTCGVFRPSNPCAIWTTPGYVYRTAQSSATVKTGNDAVLVLS